MASSLYMPTSSFRAALDLARGNLYAIDAPFSGEQFYSRQRPDEPNALHDGDWFVGRAELAAKRATRTAVVILAAGLLLTWLALQ